MTLWCRSQIDIEYRIYYNVSVVDTNNMRKRCFVSECTKSAVGATAFCVAHGGGKRCSMAECTKSAVGATAFCKAHGGGKR
uniref:WRKY19-like zinc finger domain-containing protein n=1 Tax=viral metagenome TaxID=1070528 RepID=A0A6C0LYC8_9ZZZZ